MIKKKKVKNFLSQAMLSKFKAIILENFFHSSKSESTIYGFLSFMSLVSLLFFLKICSLFKSYIIFSLHVLFWCLKKKS
jgi:hypothetical protein